MNVHVQLFSRDQPTLSFSCDSMTTAVDDFHNVIKRLSKMCGSSVNNKTHKFPAGGNLMNSEQHKRKLKVGLFWRSVEKSSSLQFDKTVDFVTR